MTPPHLDHPMALWLLALCLPPLLGWGSGAITVASLRALPRDGISVIVDGGLRVLAALPVLWLTLGLAGPYRPRAQVTRLAGGAHVIVALDRSLSMHEPFALRGRKATESKTQASARLLAAFFARNPHSRFGIVGFSTAPILIMPLTEHRAAIAAAIAAQASGQLGDTDIGSGIAYALAMFGRDDPAAPHVILLITDGAGEIPEQVRLYLAREFHRVHAHLYYLYLRAGDDPPLDDGLVNDTDMTHPAALDAYFRSLHVPYAGFEASDAGAVAAVTARIERIESRPLPYTEDVPRRNYARLCFRLAALFLALHILLLIAERRDMPAGYGA